MPPRVTGCGGHHRRCVSSVRARRPATLRGNPPLPLHQAGRRRGREGSIQRRRGGDRSSPGVVHLVGRADRRGAVRLGRLALRRRSRRATVGLASRAAFISSRTMCTWTAARSIVRSLTSTRGSGGVARARTSRDAPSRSRCGGTCSSREPTGTQTPHREGFFATTTSSVSRRTRSRSRPPLSCSSSSAGT